MRRYLGDAVYVDFDPWGAILLTTWDGERDTNSIALDVDTLREFLRWVIEIRSLEVPLPKPPPEGGEQ